jgi:predicted transcriptional regulator of viral defense system
MLFQDLPTDIRAKLRPAFPRLQPLLQVFVSDPRELMYTDSVAAGLYVMGVTINRSALTQLLHHAVKRGYLERQGRGRYGITGSGRAFLETLTI